MAIYKFNFRREASWVTGEVAPGETWFTCDDAGTTPVDNYPRTNTARTALTFGIEAGGISNARDRDNTIDRRLAGCCWRDAASGVGTLRIDLTNTGVWGIRLAMGDTFDNGTDTNYVRLLDGTTAWQTYDLVKAAGGYTWANAAGAWFNQTTWPSNNVQITNNFASTILRIELVNAAATKFGYISHIELDDSPGGAPVYRRSGMTGGLVLSA